FFRFFFFQAEDGIRDFHVTGVQTCALPISLSLPVYALAIAQGVIAAIVTAAFGFSRPWIIGQLVAPPLLFLGNRLNVPDWVFPRSEERRVGKGGRAGGAASRARQESVRDET